MKPASRSLMLALLMLVLLLVLIVAAPASAATPPYVTSLSPTFGGSPGGTGVIITGGGFTAVSGVTFGGVSAASFTVTSSTQITATAPAFPTQSVVNVVVTTPLGSSATAGAGDDFAYCLRYEQSSPNFLYTGTWTTASAPSASGASYRYATATGASMAVAFLGDHFTWLGKMGADQGVAAISVDGGAFFTFDLYNSVTLYKRALFTWNPKYGAHVVVIKVTGTKNAASTGTSVNVDAFDFTGSPTPYTRYEQIDPGLLYTGTWSTFSTASASGGSYKRSSDPKAEVSIPWYGTRLDVYGMKGLTGGLVDMYVDGSETPWQTIDLSAGSAQYKQKLASITDASLHSHIVVFKPNPLSPAGKFINIDYVEVIQQLSSPYTYEQTQAGVFAFTGSWSTLASSVYSGGSFAYANTAGSAVSLGLHCMRLDLFAKTGPNYGIAKITLDGKETLVDLYSSTAKYKQVVWSSGWLAPGPHNLKIEWTGTKRAAATKTNINVDAVRLWSSV